jgi:hypothetical protein
VASSWQAESVGGVVKERSAAQWIKKALPLLQELVARLIKEQEFPGDYDGSTLELAEDAIIILNGGGGVPVPELILASQAKRGGASGLNRAALAEHVTTEETGEYGPALYITFDFLCPNCGRRHWAREVAANMFDAVSWQLPCGLVEVRMPWAPSPARDTLSIYGAGKRPGVTR